MATIKSSRSSKRQKNEQSIMGTNNSSIVSKRSVERLYYPEPHFFRYFVKKPQRRAPLINRGYWLRMHAVETVVRNFLEEPSAKRKIVLNLGCGYDPLAFQWLSKHAHGTLDALFVDIDFPELIEIKSKTVCSTPQLWELLIDPIIPLDTSTGIHLQSDNYHAVGCDLADIRRLDGILASLVDLSNCLVLCTAEVSITYMDVEAADSVIAWAALQGDVRFCLIEQHLPDGKDHPFAQKMAQHFNNLQTPLKNIEVYPQLSHQAKRFSRAGWQSMDLRSLWDIFCDPDFTPRKQRAGLDDVEPFDEWEEFVTFASHYFLLVARNQPVEQLVTKSLMQVANPPLVSGNHGEYITQPSTTFQPFPKRRFASVFYQGGNLGHFSGLGPQSRVATIDFYTLESELPTDATMEHSNAVSEAKSNLPDDYEPRMCHTSTIIDSKGVEWLSVGGRKSPDQPLRDCWLLRDQRWLRSDALPIPLYRHCQTHLSVRFKATWVPAVLVYGGKTSQKIVSNGWFLWRDTAGWVEVMIKDVDIDPRFGAVIASDEYNNGLLTGGMTEDGTICQDFWLWSVTYDKTSGWRIKLTRSYVVEEQSDLQAVKYSHRFGASIERTSGGFLLIGGVSDKIIPERYEVVEFSPVSRGGTKYESPLCLASTEFGSSDQDKSTGLRIRPVISTSIAPRPLLIGHSSILRDGQIIIIGGGAVCFSFGSFWNTVPITLAPLTSNEDNRKSVDVMARTDVYRLQPSRAPKIRHDQVAANSNESFKHAKQVEPVAEGPSATSAHAITQNLNERQPIVCRNCDLGPCVTEWQSLETLKDRVGSDRSVVVHLSDESHMDFQQKNFAYAKKSFGKFIDDFQSGRKQYLRSLASEDPTGQPANLTDDFPRLACDFHLLGEMHRATDQVHSSILRVSGSVNMWLHYDVMANVLCQIRGSKRLILFPPSDVSYLGLPAGSSTSSIDCFDAGFLSNPAVAPTHPQEVLLQPGDVLHIPPLWLHTASPSDAVSVSVNVFYRSLHSGYAPGRDVYGNRDVQAYEKGRRDIAKITQSFDGLPSDMRNFYLDRLIDELKQTVAKSRQQHSSS